MERMPFDGVVMRMGDGLSSAVQRQEPVGHEVFRNALAPLKNADLKSLKHNFLIVYSTPAGDIFDNWSTPLDNYSNMAKAASATDLEGIFFDNEECFGCFLRLSTSKKIFTYCYNNGTNCPTLHIIR